MSRNSDKTWAGVGRELVHVVVGSVVVTLVLVVALIAAGLWDTIPPDGLTGTSMVVMKRRILRYAREHDAPPARVADLPPLEGYTDSVVDGYGNAIEMEIDGDRVVLRSLGQDGAIGGEGDALDVVGEFPLRSPDGQWADEMIDWTVGPFANR